MSTLISRAADTHHETEPGAEASNAGRWAGATFSFRTSDQRIFILTSIFKMWTSFAKKRHTTER